MKKLTYEFPVEVESDTTWKYGPSARPNRGLHDYVRTIKFTRKLLEHEKKKFETFMVNFDNPGWCNWSCRSNDGDQTFNLTATWDSSD
jgi:hypothetical protein